MGLEKGEEGEGGERGERRVKRVSRVWEESEMGFGLRWPGELFVVCEWTGEAVVTWAW